MDTLRGRLIAVGDIHGYFSSLCKLLEKINPTSEDKIVFLGDYINIGSESRKVVDFLIKIKEKFPKSIFLKGNHEQMFLDYLSGEDKTRFLANGGYSTLRTYGGINEFELPVDHMCFFEELVSYHEDGGYVFVHAGFEPGVPIEKNSINAKLWIRDEFIFSDYSWGKRVIFGHSPFERPFIDKNKIGLNCDVNNIGVVVGCDVRKEEFWFSENCC